MVMVQNNIPYAPHFSIVNSLLTVYLAFLFVLPSFRDKKIIIQMITLNVALDYQLII